MADSPTGWPTGSLRRQPIDPAALASGLPAEDVPDTERQQAAQSHVPVLRR